MYVVNVLCCFGTPCVVLTPNLEAFIHFHIHAVEIFMQNAWKIICYLFNSNFTCTAHELYIRSIFLSSLVENKMKKWKYYNKDTTNQPRFGTFCVPHTNILYSTCRFTRAEEKRVIKLSFKSEKNSYFPERVRWNEFKGSFHRNGFRTAHSIMCRESCPNVWETINSLLKRDHNSWPRIDLTRLFASHCYFLFMCRKIYTQMESFVEENYLI